MEAEAEDGATIELTWIWNSFYGPRTLSKIQKTWDSSHQLKNTTGSKSTKEKWAGNKEENIKIQNYLLLKAEMSNRYASPWKGIDDT